MKFSSIKEYFYKLQSRCYALLLLSLCFMIGFYLIKHFIITDFKIQDEETKFLVRIILPMIGLVELTSVHLLTLFQFQKVRKIPSLGDRLDQCATLATIRMAVGVTTCLIMIVGLALTESEMFVALFALCLLFIFLQRLNPDKICNQLQLKGDERQLILKGELI
jgi:hypothetical protein